MIDQTINFSFDAPQAVIYRAMLNAELLPRWRVPDDMEMEVHRFEPVENGRFRISLAYRDKSMAGKSGGHIDTYRGYFQTLVPNQKIIEVVEFETSNEAMKGVMTITTQLQPFYGSTLLIATHENLPPGLSPEKNKVGWTMALRKLADLIEAEKRFFV